MWLSSAYVDVRDLALAHALAVTKPEAAGNRIIVHMCSYKWQDFGEFSSHFYRGILFVGCRELTFRSSVSIAHRLYPELPAGNTAYDPTKATHLLSYVPDKQRKLLGVPLHTIEETTRDTIEDFKARGWL